MSAEKADVAWYNAFPRRGAVYDLAFAAASGTDKKDRLRAVVALGKSGDPRAVRPLIDLIADRDPEIRSLVVCALGSLKSGRSVEVLIGCMKDRNEQAGIRKEAAVALAAIRSTGAIQGLKEFALDDGEDPEVRTAVKGILDGVGTW
ncbi:MAG: HEAT repeat domain-containing protein [Methanoregula sp.]|nr:HEAT repeat domain-containing protein [Methanoregula sp.]